jgi:hypothetical protein
MQMRIEAIALIILILSGYAWSIFGGSGDGVIGRFWFPGAFQNRRIAIGAIGVLAFLGSAAPAIYYGFPQPMAQDEFSYLLAADTFAHGRLTNPANPMWKHFESFHILQQPTYASKYPPGQGIALAIGQVFFGHPIVGVWLSTAAACSAIFWMLCGWCPVEWAWTGSLVAVVRLALSYWAQSYWGGSVAALGGALVFGALPRIRKKQKAADSAWLAVGLVILANSRPFEGLVVTFPVMAGLAVWLVKSGKSGLPKLSRRVFAPMAPILVFAAVWMGYYNYRVTGHPLLMPYFVYQKTYDLAPIFLWQSLTPHHSYDRKIMQDFYTGVALRLYQVQHHLLALTVIASVKMAQLWSFFVGALFTMFFVEFRLMLRRRNVRFALGTCALLSLALLSETWMFPHYAAPAAGLAFLLVVEALRQAQLTRWRGKRVGRLLVRAVLPLLLLSSVLSFPMDSSKLRARWAIDRHKIACSLGQQAGKHLVIVRYGPGHCVDDEWVYNRADINSAKVVWAADLGARSNRELIDSFTGRRVWLLEPDRLPRRPVVYPLKR